MIHLAGFVFYVIENIMPHIFNLLIKLTTETNT